MDVFSSEVISNQFNLFSILIIVPVIMYECMYVRAFLSCHVILLSKYEHTYYHCANNIDLVLIIYIEIIIIVIT